MLVERMIRAARLDSSLYNEVERDLNATGQALTVVVIVAVAGGIGQVITLLAHGRVGEALGGLVSGILSGIVGWIAWSLITYFVGTSLFGGTATPGEMLRCIGFANTPLVLGIFVFIPCLGGLIALGAAIWALVAGIVAVREALDFTTERAILTAIVGFLAYVIIIFIVGLFGFGLRLLF